MSRIDVQLDGDLLKIECVRARQTESDIEEIDITTLQFNKRYRSVVTIHSEKEMNRLLFLQPIQEEQQGESQLQAAIFVLATGKKILYGCMEQEKIYKLMISMKYKVLKISLNKRYLKLKMLGYLINEFPIEIEKIRFVIDEKNQVEDTFCIENKQLSRRSVLKKRYYHSYKIPVKDLLTDETQINNMLNIVVTVNGVDLEFRIGKKEKGMSNIRMYYAPYRTCYRDDFALHLRRTDRGNFAIVKRPVEEIEKTTWFKFMESKAVSWLFYHLGRRASSRAAKPVSLFYEKFSEKAEEGTFDLFEIARDRNTADCYYIIDKNSPDYERIKDSKNVVAKYSLKYYWLIYRVNSYISTEAPAHLNILRSNNKYFRMSTCEHPFVFLQHGVTYLKCQGEGSTFAVGKEGEPQYMIVGSKKEQDVVSDMLGLPEERLLNTGLPIFSKIDYKHMDENTEDKIVIMLTWKGYEEHIQEFENSDYFKNVMAIYHMLTKYTDSSNIIIVPHPKMAELLENTPLNDTMWKRPISEVLGIAKLLITDYSSVCYNSFYQGGAVIFYQPDLELYEQEVGPLIPSDEEYIGVRTFDMEELERAVERIIVDGKILLEEGRTREYERRYDTINEYHDGRNIERIAQELAKRELI